MSQIVDTPIKLSPWRLRSPMVQNLIASLVLAMTPGIYLGITQLGAGAGKSASIVVNSKVNVIIYAVFTVVSVVAGPFINFLGPKLCLAFGTTGYAMYVGGLWYIETYNLPGFPLFTGAYLGVTAGFLWTACAYTSQAYGTESKKAWYIQVQLVFQASGSAVASAIAFAANYNKTTAGGVQYGVYAAFIAIHLAGGLIALLFIVDPKTVQRDDGTYLAVFPRPSPKAELVGMWEAVRQPRVMYYILAGFAFDLWIPPLGSWNAATFSLRARGLNALCFYFMQMISGFIVLFCAMCPWIKKRRHRAYLMLGYVALINAAGFAGWIGYLAVSPNTTALDWTSGPLWGKAFVVYMFMGLLSTSLRNFVYWANAVATNDPAKQARYAGLMHAMPQAGLCVAFGIQTLKPKFLNMAIPYLVVTMLAIGLCGIGVKKHLQETLYGQEEHVIVPLAEAKAMGVEDAPITEIKEKDLAAVDVVAARE